MIRALVSGTLHESPTVRTSQAGKSFTTAKLRADGKDGATVWCSLIAFGEIGERLASMNAGAAMAVSGRMEASAWLDKQGEPKAGLSLVVDELATLKGKPRPPQEGRATANDRARPNSPPHPRPAQRTPVAAGLGFDDDLPDFM